jgi:hypothetical protein
MGERMAKTVFILGAGSSNEARLPIGSELLNLIAKSLNIKYDRGAPVSGDLAIANLVNLLSITPSARSPNQNDYQAVGRFVSGAMPQAISIDNFIDAHTGEGFLELCGKLRWK